jgi:hypothetical protein
MRACEREHSLMQAILADAVQCLFGTAAGSRRDRGRLALQARAWVTEREPTAPLGFEDVCHALDLDPTAVRRRLLAIADHAAGATDAAPPSDIDSALEALVDGGLLRAVGDEENRRVWAAKAERNAEMLGLRRAGWSLRALAQRFGVSVSRACTICVQAERAQAADDVTASRRSATKSDAAVPPSAAERTTPASTSGRRPPSLSLLPRAPAPAEPSLARDTRPERRPTDTRSERRRVDTPRERRRIPAER